MKITGFIVLSFLLFALTATSFPVAVHAKVPAAVLDIHGNEVTAGANYFIGAASNDFAVSATSPIICNSDVLLTPMSHGLPVTFSPVVKSDNSVIHEDSYLNVDFVAPTCRMAGVTTMWKMEFRAIVRGFAVTTGGVDRMNRFKITKYGGDNDLFSKAESFELFQCSLESSNASLWLSQPLILVTALLMVLPLLPVVPSEADSLPMATITSIEDEPILAKVVAHLVAKFAEWRDTMLIVATSDMLKQTHLLTLPKLSMLFVPLLENLESRPLTSI